MTMQSEIDGASILGFIPSAYPAGLVLAERWNHDTDTMERITGTVEDVERSDYIFDVQVFVTLKAARLAFIRSALS